MLLLFGYFYIFLLSFFCFWIDTQTLEGRESAEPEPAAFCF